MLSQTAEYALRAVVYIAENGNRPRTIKEIAGPTQVPQGYLAKVMLQLARHGIVVSQRGLGGGFSLAKSPDMTTILDVVQAVDPIRRITRCPLNNPAHASQLCSLHQRLDEAAAHIEETFRDATIAEMIGTPVFPSPDRSSEPAG
jgi:Rrf2 family nitric oxide-sensitive transcriptional repressor